MSINIIAEGKTTTEAIENGLKQLNDSKNITENSFDNDDVAFGFHYHNYHFITKDVINENKFVFYYACKYNYYEVVEFMLKCKSINLNIPIILKKINY